MVICIDTDIKSKSNWKWIKRYYLSLRILCIVLFVHIWLRHVVLKLQGCISHLYWQAWKKTDSLVCLLLLHGVTVFFSHSNSTLQCENTIYLVPPKIPFYTFYMGCNWVLSCYIKKKKSNKKSQAHELVFVVKYH